MNLKEVKEILEMMKSADVAEFEMEKENTKIKIKKYSGLQPQTCQPPAVPAQQAYGGQQQVQPAPGAPALEAENKTEAKPEAEKYLVIKSPMVGTFYRSSAPDTPAYVQEGDMVTEGQTVCIIEAMKLMNEIKSEVRGKLIKMLIENGQAVEYNQPLFYIEPINSASA